MQIWQLEFTIIPRKQSINHLILQGDLEYVRRTNTHIDSNFFNSIGMKKKEEEERNTCRGNGCQILRPTQ
jgi:hypothetical protein